MPTMSPRSSRSRDLNHWPRVRPVSIMSQRCSVSSGGPAAQSAIAGVATAVRPRQTELHVFGGIDQPETLGQHQRVIVHREAGVAKFRAHLGAVPETFVPGPPLRD
jgi:hypothetical protein